MTTLGIFGDSYCDESFGHPDFIPEGDRWAWFYNIPEYTATTHGRGGANLYYIYKQFLEHHNKYDKVVVVLTQYERIPGSNIDLIGHNKPVFLPGLEQINYYLKKYEKVLTIQNVNKLKALRDFYLWAQDDTVCYDIGKLIVDKIKLTRPDAIMINGFYHGGGPNKGKSQFPEIGGPTMIEYLDAMIRGITTDFSDFEFPHLKISGRPEIRGTCHLSKEANLVLAKDVYHALTVGAWNPIVPYAIPHEIKDLDYYYGQRMW